MAIKIGQTLRQFFEELCKNNFAVRNWLKSLPLTKGIKKGGKKEKYSYTCLWKCVEILRNTVVAIVRYKNYNHAQVSDNCEK